MKKYFEKHNLVKTILLFLVALTILTWIIPSGTFEKGTFEDLGLLRISIYDFFMTFYYGIFYFLTNIAYFLIIGGFYGVVSKSREYSSLVSTIANKIKTKENLFIAIITLFIAVFTSINCDPMFCVAFIPFIISILSKNKVNKFKAFGATFGALFVGQLGATYNEYFGNYVTNQFGLTLADGVVTKFVLLAIAVVVLIGFILSSFNGKEDPVEDMFEPVEIDKKRSSKLLNIVLVLFSVFAIFIFIPWKTSFGLEFFDKFYEGLMTFNLGDVPIASHFLDKQYGIYPYGSYEKIFDMAVVLVIMSLVISKISKIKFDSYISSFVSGMKKMMKPVGIFIMVSAVFALAYWSPIGNTIVNKLLPAGKEFNVFLFIIAAFVLAILNVDHGFTLYSVGSYLSKMYASQAINVIIILNAVYGVAQFIFPSSYLLFFGLACLNISYPEYLKKMWKFIVALTVGVLVALVAMVLL